MLLIYIFINISTDLSFFIFVIYDITSVIIIGVITTIGFIIIIDVIIIRKLKSFSSLLISQPLHPFPPKTHNCSSFLSLRLYLRTLYRVSTNTTSSPLDVTLRHCVLTPSQEFSKFPFLSFNWGM